MRWKLGRTLADRPLRALPVAAVENHRGSRVEYIVKVRAQFKRRSTANNVEIHVPVPDDADSPKFRVRRHLRLSLRRGPADTFDPSRRQPAASTTRLRRRASSGRSSSLRAARTI